MTCFRLSTGETLNHYCIRNNISYPSIFNRIEEGMTIEEALKRYKRGKDNNVKYRYKGRSVASILIYNSKKYRSAIRLIKKGVSVNEAVERFLNG